MFFDYIPNGGKNFTILRFPKNIVLITMGRVVVPLCNEIIDAQVEKKTSKFTSDRSSHIPYNAYKNMAVYDAKTNFKKP